jgi:carbon monoxide dehydrogenase subunit G
MKLSGEYRVPVAEQAVWEGMNDPALLKRCIAICESFERLSETLFQARLRIRVGPFSAPFAADIHVEDAEPPHFYRLQAQGKGGLMGWAKAEADVKLVADGCDTILHYNAHAQLEGALARIAANALEGAAQRYADEFFGEFARQVVLKTEATRSRASL